MCIHTSIAMLWLHSFVMMRFCVCLCPFLCIDVMHTTVGLLIALPRQPRSKGYCAKILWYTYLQHTGNVCILDFHNDCVLQWSLFVSMISRYVYRMTGDPPRLRNDYIIIDTLACIPWIHNYVISILTLNSLNWCQFSNYCVNNYFSVHSDFCVLRFIMRLDDAIFVRIDLCA